MQQLNWDNLRYVLAVAQQGSVASAARALGVNRTTVLRRIDSFQSDLGCRIFERTPSGYALTLEAEKIIEAAGEVESTLLNIQRQIAGRELKLEGELRLTTTDTLMISRIGPALASFHRKHPRIRMTILIDNNLVDLNRRDADIAIRPTREPDPDLIAHHMGIIRFAVYASPTYLAESKIRSFDQCDWIGLDTNLVHTAPGKWIEQYVPKERICLRCNSFVGLKVAAENAIGATLLPHYFSEQTATPLQTLEAPTTGLESGLWMLTHPDMMRSAKVEAFIQHFTDELGVPE